MGIEDLCNTGLSLGLSHPNRPYEIHQHKKIQTHPKLDQYFSLTLGLPLGEKITIDHVHKQAAAASSVSAVSSYSNSSSVKREREFSGEEVEKMINSKVSDEDEEGSGRKKLRLSKEQSVVLEDSFKQHSTLNPRQKQALAKQLNLRPRQVEVWFQNRRARTKLKQTEVDCDLLKKCCETLTDENRRLHKELQELKSVKLTTPFYMQLPAATLTMCPSCERISGGGDDNNNSSKNPLMFQITSNPHLYNPFTNPSSAAC